ncbi:MAG: hypothetical protein E7366_03035 [Clostridiales bacterium]|nr:hypothetical protein [Clostridiales bacterium]
MEPWQIIAIVLAALLVFCVTSVLVVVFPQWKASEKRRKQVRIWDKGEVKMIAHRGLSGLYMENTLPAFEAAGQRSYYGIETDVHVTKDGKFIVAHDDDLKRIAGLDIVIEETTYEELRALRFKDMNGKSEEKNLYLPSLNEYIEVCKKYDKQAILELKNEMKAEEVWAIAEAIKAQGWYERTTFISFAGENLLRLREKYADADAQFLAEDSTDEEIEFMIQNKLDADLCWTHLTKAKVDRLHAAGLKVNCWTVDGRVCATLIKSCGVDFITSNILE